MNLDTAIELTQKRYKSSFESFLDVKFTKYSQGYCEIELELKEHHLNIGRTAHGGVINAMADIALSGAVTCSFAEINDAQGVVTMQMNVYFLKPGLAGETLIAYGEVVKAGKTIYYVEGGVKTKDGKLVARANGNWFVKRN